MPRYLLQKNDLAFNLKIIIFQLYISWLDETVYSDVTYPRYGSVYPWPLNIFLTKRKQNQITKKLAALGWLNKGIEEVSHLTSTERYSVIKICA